jgi:hypothetical protein
MPKVLTVDAIAVAEEVARRRVVWGAVHDLLGGALSSGVLRCIEVDGAPAVVGEHDEDEQDAEASGGHGEEVDRDQVAAVVSEERPPGLRGLGEGDWA